MPNPTTRKLFWRFIHNAVAHPLLETRLPAADLFHEFTAERWQRAEMVEQLDRSTGDLEGFPEPDADDHLEAEGISLDFGEPDADSDLFPSFKSEYQQRPPSSPAKQRREEEERRHRARQEKLGANFNSKYGGHCSEECMGAAGYFCDTPGCVRNPGEGEAHVSSPLIKIGPVFKATEVTAEKVNEYCAKLKELMDRHGIAIPGGIPPRFVKTYSLDEVDVTFGGQKLNGVDECEASVDMGAGPSWSAETIYVNCVKCPVCGSHHTGLVAHKVEGMPRIFEAECPDTEKPVKFIKSGPPEDEQPPEPESFRFLTISSCSACGLDHPTDEQRNHGDPKTIQGLRFTPCDDSEEWEAKCPVTGTAVYAKFRDPETGEYPGHDTPLENPANKSWLDPEAWEDSEGGD